MVSMVALISMLCLLSFAATVRMSLSFFIVQITAFVRRR
jgi:hypothetical protein